MSFENASLPAGWEAKFDSNIGKTYYINHNEKTTTWDPPYKNKRSTANTSTTYSKQTNGAKHLTNMGVEFIPLQHGPSDLRRNYVYPTQPPPIPAFQISPHQSPKINIYQDLTSKTRASPLTVRPRIQDSSLTVFTDTDEAVSKISATFPTVSEAHIRLLMKKFHNREVLVISALQVEKNPIITPGPFSTPPPQRNVVKSGVYAPFHMTPALGVQSYSMSGSPILRGGSGPSSIYTGSPRVGDGFRTTSRPHSSPKLKLRYMKSIFPQAEETIILDILSNNDNSIQKSSEKLREMGFEKKDNVKISQQKNQSNIVIDEAGHSSPKSTITIPRIRSSEEKIKAKMELQNRYKDIPERLIIIALESVDFDEDKASSLLRSFSQDAANVEQGRLVGLSESDNADAQENRDTIPSSHSRQSLKSLLKSDKSDKDKVLVNRVLEECNSEHRSANISSTRGANPELAKGNNDKLLLEDYVKWHGPNSSLRKGSEQGLAKGPNSAYLLDRHIRAFGPNSAFHKGPNKNSVKGSIFQQMKAVVTIGGESRGK